MHRHEIIRCRDCGRIIKQCHCEDKRIKDVTYIQCPACKSIELELEHRGGCRSCD
jgi:hypothetical protein